MNEFEAKLICNDCGCIPLELWLEPIEGSIVKRHKLVLLHPKAIDTSKCPECGGMLARDR